MVKTLVNTQLSIIVAMDGAGAIGKNNAIPWYLPEDLKYFKNLTWGHPVIMGWKTFQSLRNKMLPGRLNIVLSRQENSVENPFLVFADTIEKACLQAEKWQTKEIFIIGGGSIYNLFLPFTTKIYCTRLEAVFEHTDAFFPSWDTKKWLCKSVVRNNNDRFSSPSALAFQCEIWERKI